MLITNKKAFAYGSMLMVSFVALFVVIIMPIFPGLDGKKTTGLHYADDIFNSLSKGSANAFDAVTNDIEKSKDKEINYTISIVAKKDSPFTQEILVTEIVKILEKTGATVSAENNVMQVNGNLGAILTEAVNVSKLMYNNDAEAVTQLYDGADPFLVTYAWWQFLSPSIKALQKENKIQEAKVVDRVMRRAVETGYNFYGITATKVSDEFLLMAALLIFYVVYTMWYGFAIFQLFDGIGLTMSKSKHKEER